MSGKDYAPGAKIYHEFSTFTASTGSLGTLSNGVLTISREGGAASSTTGGSLTMDAGGVVGRNIASVDTSDGSFYLGSCDYAVRLSAGSVGTTSANGIVLFNFSLAKQTADARKFGGSTVTVDAGGTVSLGANGARVRITEGTLASNTFAADGITRIQSGLATTTQLGDGTVVPGSFTTNAAGLIVSSVFDGTVEGNYSLKESAMLWNAAAAGKLSGAGTTNILIRDLADSKNRIDATVDGSGNRTAITTDVT